jgi:hypothetical protein
VIITTERKKSQFFFFREISALASIAILAGYGITGAVD